VVSDDSIGWGGTGGVDESMVKGWSLVMSGRDVRRASTRDRRALGSKDQWVLTMILLSNAL